MLFGIIIKYLIVIILTLLIHFELKRKFIESFVCGWLGAQLLILVGMVLTSSVNRMETMTLGGILCAFVLIGGSVIWNRSKRWNFVEKKIALEEYFSMRRMTYEVILDSIIAAAFIALSSWIIIHSFYYYDCMTDAYCYGMTRIEMWIKHKSILVNMHSVAKNIFVNEWNGELNGLYYGLMSMNPQAIMFGNAELYVVSIFILFVAVEQVFPNIRNKLLIVALFLFTPLSFLMAMTVKGDYLYIVTMMLGISYFYNAIRQSSRGSGTGRYETIASIGFVSYGSGGKITGCALAGIIIVILFVKMLYEKMGICTILSGMGIGLLGGSRFVLNTFYYHNPIERTSCEVLHVDPMTVPIFLRDVVKNVWNYDNAFDYAGAVGPIMVDYGISGRFIIAIILVSFSIFCYRAILHKEKVDTKQIILIGTLILAYIATILFVGGGGNKEYGFLRLYTPFIFYFALLASGYLLDWLKGKLSYVFKAVFALVLIFGAVSTYKISTLPGEVTIGDLEEARVKNSLQRQYATHPYVLDMGETGSEEIYGAQRVVDLIEPGSKVLCCNYVATIVSWLYGNDMKNTVWFCYPNELEERITNEQWDVIAISCEYMGEEYELPFTPDVYPEAIHSWRPTQIDELLQEDYELYKPNPEVCRLWVYVKK